MLRRLAAVRLTPLLCAGLACAWPALASAAGLTLPEADAAALGRAGAATALPDGPSAVYYNPAGLAIGRGLSVQAGIAVEHERLSLTTGDATSQSRSTLLQPTLFVGQRLGDHFGLGVGVYRAPTQALEYGDGFSGRFRVQRADFGGTTLAPTVAGRPFSWLSIGFGLEVTFSELDLSQAMGDPRYETRRSIHGQAVGLGGSIGLWARLYRDYLIFGWAYHSAADLDHSGRFRTTLPGSDTTLAVQDGRITLPIPHRFSFALASKPRRGMAVSIEARLALLGDLTGYTVKDTAEPPATLLSIPVSAKQQVQLRAGLEQKLIGERLALRIGVGYDLGATRADVDPAFPDFDRVLVAAGLGYNRPDFALDAGYLGSFSPGGTGTHGTTYAADYAAQRHTVGLSLRVRIETVGPRPSRFD